MTLIVQNDTATIANANAYIDVDYFKAYHDERDQTYLPYSDPDISAAIIRATDYLDTRFIYIGQKRLQEQTTEWPRINAYDRDRYYISVIPSAVKEATAEYALRALGQSLNIDPVRDATGRIIQSKTERVDVISESIVYTNGAIFELPRYPLADQKLIKRGLVIAGAELRRA